MSSEKSESNQQELSPRLRELMRKIERVEGWFGAIDVRATKAELNELKQLGYLEDGRPPHSGCNYYKMKQQLCDECGQPLRGGCLCSASA